MTRLDGQDIALVSRRASSISPQLALAMARQQLGAGRLDEAEALCRAILADTAGDEGARSVLNEVIARRGTPAERELRRGDALLHNGQIDQAIVAYRSAIAIDPELPEAHANLGSALKRAGYLTPAIEAFSRAIALQPERSLFHGNLGLAFAAAGRMEEARRAYEQATSLDAANADAWYHLGNLLADERERDAAIVAYRRAITARPGFARAYSNLGMALHNAGDIAGSITAYSACIELEPVWSQPRWNRALSHLLLGDFARGWAAFDQRNRLEPPSSRVFSQPMWGGEHLPGKTILLHTEMGLGDSIQFCRYAPLVATREMRVLLQCEPALVELFQSLPGVAQVFAIGQQLERFDVQASLMSMPAIFKSDLSTIPRTVPYLGPDPRRVRQWGEKLEAGDRRLRVGVASAGRPQHQYDRERSIHPSKLARWWKIDGVDFYNLHKRAPGCWIDEQAIAGSPMIDFTPELRTFADTAALISHLDLVIAVDTATAHLAGAMGKAVWLLLAYVPDWRWLLERMDSPWYPTMQLYRQPKLDDWTSVIDRVGQDLLALAGRRG